MSDGRTMSSWRGLSRRRRVLLGGVFALLTVGLLAGSLLLVAVGSDRERVDRASARALAMGVDVISQGVVSAFGQLGRDPLWLGLGLHRYEPTLGVWEPLGADERVGERAVLLIHGLDEPGGIWDQLAPALAGDGHTVLRFDYRNDQAISRSTDELESAMRELASNGLGELDLVCHSMGGLVARDWLTRAGYSDGGIRVGVLITLGTPHGGSAWARLRAIAEMREQVQRWAESDDLDPMRLLGFLDDGSGEAGEDLMPGSEYLNDLNARAMPEGVRVICVVGRADEPSTMAGSVGSASARAALGELLGDRQAGVVLDEIDRLGREFGDGVVPATAAVMDGADEVFEVRANHRSMIRTIEFEESVRSRMGWPQATEPPAIAIVREWLRGD